MSKAAHRNPTMAELQALQIGFEIAYENNLFPLEINIDSTEVINMLTHGNPLYANILFECRYLIQKLGNVTVSYVFREQNTIADNMSKKGTRCSEFGKSTILIVSPIFANKHI